jgi:hypothetical protein
VGCIALTAGLFQSACSQAVDIESKEVVDGRLNSSKPEVGQPALAESAPEQAAVERQIDQPATVDDDPKHLIGLDRQNIAELLGRPRIVRRDAPAEVWQYSGPNCVLDVFFYEQGMEFRVVHIEARDRRAIELDTRLCFNDLLELLRARHLDRVG